MSTSKLQDSETAITERPIHWDLRVRVSSRRQGHFGIRISDFGFRVPHKTERPSPAFDDLSINRDLTERSARFYTEEFRAPG